MSERGGYCRSDSLHAGTGHTAGATESEGAGLPAGAGLAAHANGAMRVGQGGRAGGRVPAAPTCPEDPLPLPAGGVGLGLPLAGGCSPGRRQQVGGGPLNTSGGERRRSRGVSIWRGRAYAELPRTDGQGIRVGACWCSCRQCGRHVAPASLASVGQPALPTRPPAHLSPRWGSMAVVHPPPCSHRTAPTPTHPPVSKVGLQGFT